MNENAEPFISPAPIPKLSSELLDKNTSSMDEIDYSSLHPLDIRLQEDLFDFLISSGKCCFLLECGGHPNFDLNHIVRCRATNG